MDVTTQYVFLIPLIVGIVSTAKTTGLDSRYAPVLSLILGIGFGIGASTGHVDFNVIMQGIVIGLSASGLYSGGKATLSQ